MYAYYYHLTAEFFLWTFGFLTAQTGQEIGIQRIKVGWDRDARVTQVS